MQKEWNMKCKDMNEYNTMDSVHELDEENCEFCEYKTPVDDLINAYRKYNRREYFVCFQCYESNMESLQQIL